MWRYPAFSLFISPLFFFSRDTERDGRDVFWGGLKDFIPKTPFQFQYLYQKDQKNET